MRNVVSSLFAVGLITAFVACANGSSDNPSSDVNGTDPDSGVGTQPANNNNNGDADSGGGGNTGMDSGGGNTGTDSGGGNTGMDSGGGNTGTDSGGGTNADKCPTSGATGFIYFTRYGNLTDPTTAPCPCMSNQCCYDPGNPLAPAACVTK